MKKKIKIGRPKLGKEARTARSIRIEPKKKTILEKKFGSIQKWFDLKLNEEFEGAYDAIIIPKKKKEETISVDDF